MRLIDADELKKCAISCEIHNGALTDLCVPLYQIDNAPTVELQMGRMTNGIIIPIERQTGEWIRTALYGQTCYECDNCKLHYDCISNYCPNCGADMRGSEE